MNSLFRGFSNKLAAVAQANIYHDTPRAPIDTKKEVHEIADSWFFERFGIRARSSTLICTTNFEQARSYGYTYKIIPVEPAILIYSPFVKDFLEHELELHSDSQADICKWLECKNFKIARSMNDIDPMFSGEIMVHCKHYSAVPY